MKRKKSLFMDGGKTKICSLCGEMFNPTNELLQKRQHNLCQGCDREETEALIGYEND